MVHATQNGLITCFSTLVQQCESKLRSSIGKLLLGNGLAQLIQFSSILIFSRMYTPGDFGVLGQVQSYATVAAILCTLQLHLSIPLAVTNHDAKRVVSVIVSVCYGLVALGMPIALALGRVYVFALAVAMFVGLANTFNGYLIFGGKFGNISRFYIFRSIAIVALQALLGAMRVADGLVWGAVVGEGMTAVYLAFVSESPILPGAHFNFRSIVPVIRERRSFALFGTMQELVSVSAFYAPLFFFAQYFGDAVVGQYAMASRLVWAPIILVTGSLAQVLYHEFGQKWAGKKVPIGFLKLPHIGYYPLLIAAPAACFFLRDVVVIVLGAKWRTAADMLPLVVSWGAVFVVSTPARVICRMMRQQKLHLIIDVGMLVGIAVVFFLNGSSPVRTMSGIVGIALVQNISMILIALVAIKTSALEGQ